MNQIDMIHAMREILNQNKSEHSDVTIQTTITATVGKDRDRVRITVDNKAEQIEKDRARRFERDCERAEKKARIKAHNKWTEKDELRGSGVLRDSA